MIRIRFFYKKWSHLNGLSIGIIKLENCRTSIFRNHSNDANCHVTLGDFQRWPQGEKCSLTYQYSISNEKTKVTQFTRLYRIITCLVRFNSSLFENQDYVSNMKEAHCVRQKQPPETFYKKLFLRISQYSQENTCVADSF